MKRPNGTGTVVKLSGNRRRPYVVRVPARNKYGQVIQKALSYHEKAQEAQAALDEYNRTAREGTAPAPDKLSITLQEVYHLWSSRKYEKSGAASVVSYKSSWARLEVLGGLRMREVTIDHLQSIIDRDEDAGLSKSSINNDRVLMRALYKFAMERDIVQKDYSAFLQMPTIGAKFEKGAFTELQLRQLENMAATGQPWADTVLMLCYTGFRINEFLALTPFAYNAAENYLRGGLKTQAGKDRLVPVHPKIQSYLLNRLAHGGDTIVCNEHGKRISYAWYCEHAFHPLVESVGVPQATPHWCRHTFASKLHASGVPMLESKRLLGHADKDVTEHYTHTDIDQLTAAIRMLA